MSRNRDRRQLSFERLETKSLPSSVMLLLAVPNEATCEALEQATAQAYVAPVAIQTTTADCWRVGISAHDLLCFVDANTTDATRDLAPWATPAEHACRTADEMMRLGDADLRSLVIAESLEP